MIINARNNGLYNSGIITFNYHTVYNTTNCNLGYTVTGTSNLSPCTFMYGGKKYAGFCWRSAASLNKININLVQSIQKPFFVRYYNSNTKVVLNSEINNSLVIGGNDINIVQSSYYGNATTSSKLLNARTIWGQPFDGTKNITGDLTGNYFMLRDNIATNPLLRLTLNSVNWYVQAYDTKMYFGAGVTNSLNITQTGSVGIGLGTTMPSYKLHVNGTGYFSGNITCAGEVKSNSASDARLKTNVQKLTASNLLREVNSYTFNWTDEGMQLRGINYRSDEGFIAQEIKAIAPHFTTDNMWGKGYLGIDKNKFIPYLVAGWNEHDNRISALEKENKDLRKEIESLTKLLS